MAEAGTCPTETNPEMKDPTVTDQLQKILERFEKEASADASKAKDASPWALVHLSGMRRILRAYHVLRELSVKEITKKLIHTDMTIDQKNKAEAEAIQMLDKLIDENMK